MGMLLIITLLMIGMVWGAFDYEAIGLLFGIGFVVVGWAVIFLVASPKGEEQKVSQPQTKQTRNHGKEYSAGGKGMESSSEYRSHMGYSGESWDDEETEDWDNSYQAGGLPRDLSPFSDISDPYERAGMEYALFDNLYDQWNDD